MAVVMAAGMSETKDREEALAAARVEAHKVSDEDLGRVLKKLDDKIVDLALNTGELFGELMRKRTNIKKLVNKPVRITRCP